MTRTLVAAVLCVGLASAGQLAAEQEQTGPRKMPEIVGELKGAVPRVPNPGERRIPPPVPDGIRGTVTAAKDRFLVLSIGADAGLTSGATLDIFRPGTGKYLGTVVVDRVYPKESVAVFKPADPRKALKDLKPDELPQAGDAVGRIGPGH